LLAGNRRDGNDAVTRELFAKRAREVGHVGEIIDMMLMHPTQQLAGTEGLVAPLPNLFGKRLSVEPQQIQGLRGVRNTGGRVGRTDSRTRHENGGRSRS